MCGHRTKFGPVGCKLKCPMAVSRKLGLRKSWCWSFVPSPPFLHSAAWGWTWQLEPILNHEPYPREKWCHEVRISWGRTSMWTFTWQRKKLLAWLSHCSFFFFFYCSYINLIYPRVTNKLICSPCYKFISFKSYIIIFAFLQKRVL